MRAISAEPAASLRSEHEEGLFLNLKDRLGGCIFRAKSKSEANEFVHMRLFRAPEVHFQYIRYIKEGMPIFLLVGDEIWGHFNAARDGELAIKMEGIHLAQVQIKIVKQYVPMPASMFLPIIGASFNLKSMPLELSPGQVKSLLHSFMNSHLRSHQHRESQSNPLNSNPHAYPDSWGYNRFGPPPVPADRKYTTSIVNHGDNVREAQEHRNPQPKPFRMPVVTDPTDSRPPPPPPPPPNYFRSSSPYYAEDLQHSSYRHGFGEGSKAEYAEGYTRVDHFDKPSKSTQTDPDIQKVELDNRIAALRNDIHVKGKNLEQMQEAVHGLQEENRKLKDALKEKENIVKKQLLELDDVRAEFFSFYDEENVQKGQPSGQQHATWPVMISPPTSTREHMSYVPAVPQSAPGQAPSTFENSKGVLPHSHEQPQRANGVHGAGPGRSQTDLDLAASKQQLFPAPNAVTQQLPQLSTATSSPQPVGYFYVPDTSVTVNQEDLAHHSRQPSVERVAQYQESPEAMQQVSNQQRDPMSERNAQDVPYCNFARPQATLPEPNESLPQHQANAGVPPPQGQAVNLPQPQWNAPVRQLPDYHASLPQSHGNAVSQRLPSPQKTRSTNTLGPLGDLPSPRSYSPSGLGVSQNQMGVGYESYAAKGNQDAWRR